MMWSSRSSAFLSDDSGISRSPDHGVVTEKGAEAKLLRAAETASWPNAHHLHVAKETSRTRGVGGSISETRRAESVTIEMGSMKKRIDVSIGGDPGECGADGILGINALEDCALVMDASGVAYSCGSGK